MLTVSLLPKPAYMASPRQHLGALEDVERRYWFRSDLYICSAPIDCYSTLVTCCVLAISHTEAPFSHCLISCTPSSLVTSAH